jgi:hypothetical protein
LVRNKDDHGWQARNRGASIDHKDSSIKCEPLEMRNQDDEFVEVEFTKYCKKRRCVVPLRSWMRALGWNVNWSI